MTGDSTARDPSDSTQRYSDCAAPPGPADAALPQQIGRYRILGKLGEGGMGDVLLAEDEELQRQVALKRIRPDRIGDEDLRRRFEIEARVTARLQHPSVLPVYHYQQDDSGSAFYTMRPVEGVTLRELLYELRSGGASAREAWPVARIARLFLQACNAVAFAHSRGVIHRDLKPSNIMIGRFEEVLVLDWGMAKVGRLAARPPQEGPAPELSAETESEVLVGTPSYMAPELFDGAPPGPRSDLFALGLMLYELLALRRAWEADDCSELLDAMLRRPPVSPARIQPGRNIPHELARCVLKTLSVDPQRRHASVEEFARELAGAIEGRAPWRIDPAGDAPRHWRVADGRHSLRDDCLVLRSRGAQASFRYFHQRRLPDNVRIEFELLLRKGTNELAVWLNAQLQADGSLRGGYSLGLAPGRRRTLALARSGRAVAGARAPEYETGCWHAVRVTREDDRLSLVVDGEELYGYSDPIPLTGGYLGFTGKSNGLFLRALKISARGSSARVSCLAVPDALFNRALYQEAQGEYESIAASHPGRAEGRLAIYRAALCVLRRSDHETDPELRALLLEEATELLDHPDEANDSCLVALGRAMVAGKQGRAAAKQEALAAALEQYPDDPHLPAVKEWILGQLHSLDGDQRQLLAELLPLAIRHCMGDWGSRVVGERVREVKSDWEAPPFLCGRARFRSGDPATHAEAQLLLAFWAGRAGLIVQTVAALKSDGTLRPHHLADAVFALLELQRVAEAAAVLEAVREEARLAGGRLLQVWLCCEPAVRAMEGELDLARARLLALAPDTRDRAYNSLRLWMARAVALLEGPAAALALLRRAGERDLFAREHRAWFHLLDGNPGAAERELAPLIERGEQLAGRNLCNLLHGLVLQASGMVESARRAWRALELPRWPRTWTLGSHWLAGRLDHERFESGALPWERICLQAQLDLASRYLD